MSGSPTPMNRGSAVPLIGLAAQAGDSVPRLHTGALGAEMLPSTPLNKQGLGDTETDPRSKCRGVPVARKRVINPARGRPGTVERVMHGGLLRPSKDGRGARENWRTRERAAQAAGLAESSTRNGAP